MTELSDTEVFVLDCQSTGATPELDDVRRRRIVVSGGEIVSMGDDDQTTPVSVPPRRGVTSDRASYDRLRVLVTELVRILGEGGDVTVHVRRNRVVLRLP
jgi:hypothetical protein